MGWDVDGGSVIIIKTCNLGPSESVSGFRYPTFKDIEGDVAFDCIVNRIHWHVDQGHFLTTHDFQILGILLTRIKYRGPFMYAKTLIEKLWGRELPITGVVQ
jgi:hypothetical protein